MVFEDELRDNTELYIPDDDDEANDNAYLQFQDKLMDVKKQPE